MANRGSSTGWRLLPDWAKDQKIAYRTINARAETVDKAPSFREAFAKRRCLIPADGFYEWRKTAKPKLPFAIAMKDGRPFTFAGLWENWKDPLTGEWLRYVERGAMCIILLLNTGSKQRPSIAYMRWRPLLARLAKRSLTRMT